MWKGGMGLACLATASKSGFTSVTLRIARRSLASASPGMGCEELVLFGTRLWENEEGFGESGGVEPSVGVAEALINFFWR